MKISICMMVKNESKYLNQCLNSLQKLRNSLESELIIVDTGSDDNTIDIAKKFTEKVYCHRWNNNFSEIRNITIRYAVGEWILIVDGDEIFQSTNEIISFLKSPNNKIYGAAAIQVKNLATSSLDGNFILFQSPRIFKNDGYFHYTGIVHNEPKFKGSCLALNDILIHYGYISTDSELMEKKFQRTSKLLISELLKDPKNIYYRFQLSVTYMMHSDIKESLEEIEKAYDCSIKNIELNKRYVYIYCQYAKACIVNKLYDKAIKVCLEGINYEKEYIDLYYYLAQCQSIIGNLQAAIKNYEIYLKLVSNYENLEVRLKPNITIESLSNVDQVNYNLAVIYYKMSNISRVDKYVNQISDVKFLRKSILIILEICIKNKSYDMIKRFYSNKVKKSDVETMEMFVVALEGFMKRLSISDRMKLIELFSGGNNSYFALNNIRLEYLTGNRNVIYSIQSLLEKINLNSAHDFCGDILYYLISLKKPLIDLFNTVSHNNILRFMEYLAKSYEDLPVKVFDYLNSTSYENLNDLKIIVTLEKYLVEIDKNIIDSKLKILTEQIKKKINNTIHEGRLSEANELINEYEKSISSDLEILLFKSQIYILNK